LNERDFDQSPASFILVGSGNPEEGELRPQLLDRFGMHAEIGTVKDLTYALLNSVLLLIKFLLKNLY
jgi:hypothetical protein